MACSPTAPLPLEDAVSMVNDGSEGGLRMWTPDGHGKVNSDVTRESESSAQLRCRCCSARRSHRALGRPRRGAKPAHAGQAD